MQRVNFKLLADKSGRVLIHYFYRDPAGPISTGYDDRLLPVGTLRLGGAVGRIACQPSLQTVAPRLVQGAIEPVPHSDDPRGVTCKKCKETPEYKEAMRLISETLETAREGVPQGR